MDPTENPGNRIGRTIWTVWGYLSGAVARFLRPEVTDEGNQGVRTRTDDIDLKSAVNKIDREVTAKNSNNEGKETNQIDSAEVKCSPSKVRVQVASVQWENTDVVKDDNNDELHVHTTKKQTYHCAVWSPGTDTDNEGCMVDALVEKEAVSSDEVQAENIYANNEFKESETAHELEETGKIEQKYGDNEDIEERDQNHKGEKCAKNRKDAYETDVMVQFDQDVEQEKQINMADHGETEGIAGFKHADTHLIDEQIVDQKDRGGIAYIPKNEVEEMMPETRGATEQDKEKKTVQDLEEIGQLERNDGDNEDKEECDQNHEEEKCAVESEDLDNADVKVQSELYGQDVEHEMKISMMDHAEKEGIGGFKHSDEHPIDEKENNLDQKDQEKTENDEEQGLESQVQDLQKSEDPDNANVMVQCEQDVEQEKKINIVDHGETERIAGFKHADEHLIEEKENNLNQKDQGKTENDEEKGLESQVQDLQKSKDPDNADILVQCELYGQDVEQDKLISMMDHAEKEGIGGFKHSDEHLIDEIEEQIVDQKDQGRTENDEDQGTESQVQDLLPQLEYLKKYSDEIACISKNEVEEMMPETRCATEQGKEKETVQDLEEIGQLEQNDGDNEDEEECDQNHEEEKCAVESEDLDNADVKVQSELYGQDVEQEMQISGMDLAEEEGIGGFKHSDEHPIDEKKNNLDQKDQEKTENDEEQGLESQVQDLQKSEDPDTADVMVHCEQDVEQEKQINIADHGETEGIAGFKYADEHLIEEKENSLNQKDQEKTENDEEKGLESQVQDLQKSEDPDNADILVQCEFYGQDVEQDKLINMMDHGETGGFGGFKLSDEHPIDEKENNLDQKDQRKTENDEDQGLESQVQDLQKSKDPDTADVMVQCEQDVEQEKQINIADSGETEDIGGFKHSDEHLIDEIEEQIVDQKDRGRTEKDEDQGTESQVQDLLPQLEYLKKYSDEIACISKNEVEEMMPETRDPTEQGKEKETVQDLDEIGQLEQNNGDNEYKEECDHNHEDEECAMESEDLDNVDVMVQSELYGQDVEQEMQISGMDHVEKEGIGGFKHSDEHPIDEKENNLDQKDQEKTENDEEQGLEVQDLQKSEDPNNSDILVQSELYGQDVEQDKLISMMDHAEKEGIGGFKHSDEHLIDEIEEQIVDQKDRERAENDEDQGLESQVQDLQKSEDPDNADIMVQCEQDVEQEKQINIVEHGETEGIGGFKHSDGHSIDEKEKQNVDPMDQEMTENDEEQGIESQVQDLLPQLEYFTEEADDLAKPEMLNLMEKYSDEIDEFSKKGVEEVMLETEQDEDTTESEHDTTKYELMESVETLQRVSEELSEKKVPNVELKMTTVVDEFFETVYTLEDSLLSDSKQDTSEKTPETGTGSSMVAMKTEGMVSDLIVCEFPGESSKGPETALAETDLGCFEEIKSNLHDPQTLAEEQAEREAVVVCSVEHSETLRTVETEQDIETLIESLGTTESHAHQEIDKTKFSHKEHVELRTELSEETTDIKISSEDEEAEPSEKEGQSLVIRNVTLQSHELLEFKEGECKSSLGTMDTFSESLGNSSVSEIAENAEIEHVAEEQTDVKPVLTRSLSSAGFLEETVHLQDVSERCTEEQEILETALEYVEGITNQVLKDMIETEVNLVQETEPLAGPSSEEPGDAEYQGPAQCVSADAFVLEEEGKLLGETMESKVEMEVETTSSEVLKQTEQHISSPVCETTEADGCRDIAGETVLSSHEDLMEVSRPGMKRGFDQVNKDLAEVKTERKFDLYLQAFEESSLDFTIQKTRIAVKNPLVRPPKDPRRLLFKASVEPLVSQPSPRSQKVEVSVPSKGVTGFKLPGLGAELPVLRKTEFGKKTREGGAAERTLQPQQKSVAVTEDSVKQEQAPVPVPAKPKWTPPKHPGMGSPFMMAELKSKLKKPVQE